VGAFGVVVAKVTVKVEPQPGLLGDEVAGEGRLPALVQDGLLDPLDTAVGLGRPARMKVCRALSLAMVAWKVAERNSEALSLITRSSRRPRLARSAATVRARALVQVAEGLRLVTWRVAQVEAEATSMAVSCQTVPLVPLSRPMQQQSSWTSWPGCCTSRWRSGGGAGRSGTGGAA